MYTVNSEDAEVVARTRRRSNVELDSLLNNPRRPYYHPSARFHKWLFVGSGLGLGSIACVAYAPIEIGDASRKNPFISNGSRESMQEVLSHEQVRVLMDANARTRGS